MKKWRCTVCGYIHEGPEPPEKCPVCGAPRNAFVEVAGAATAPGQAPVVRTGTAQAKTPVSPASSPVVPVEQPKEDAKAGLFALSYGMFVVSSRVDGRFNAQTCNTVFQVTSDPPRLAIGINKQNYTHEFIEAGKVLVVSVLGKGNMKHVKRFGFRSGRDVDKFEGLQFILSPKVGCPVIPDAAAYLECEVRPEMSVDVGTHTLYIADVVGGAPLKGTEPITYGFYRQNRAKPDEEVDDIDWNNVVAALNLEYGANRRYQYQIAGTTNPKVASMLEGVMRTEGDHVDNALKYLAGRLQQKAQGHGGEGFVDTLLHMTLNRDFEEIARATYSQFARETSNPALKDLFTEQARSEMGHVNIFKEVVEALQKGQYPLLFFCPVCGWELDYGSAPVAGDVKGCPKCGARFSLSMDEGNWKLTRMP